MCKTMNGFVHVSKGDEVDLHPFFLQQAKIFRERIFGALVVRTGTTLVKTSRLYRLSGPFFMVESTVHTSGTNILIFGKGDHGRSTTM